MAEHLNFMRAAVRAGPDALDLCQKAGQFSHNAICDRIRAQMDILEHIPPGVASKIDGLAGFVSSRRQNLARCAAHASAAPSGKAEPLAMLQAAQRLGDGGGPAALNAGGKSGSSIATELIDAGHRLIESQREFIIQGRASASSQKKLQAKAVACVVEALIMLDVSCGHLARQWAAVTHGVASRQLCQVGTGNHGASAEIAEDSSARNFAEVLESHTTVGWYSLEDLARVAVEEASSFCQEKFGVAPTVLVRTATHSGTMADSVRAEGTSIMPQRRWIRSSIKPLGTQDAAVVAIAHTEYALIEVLKNSMGAHVRRFGLEQMEADDCPPIVVDVGSSATQAGWRVTDSGGGCSDPVAALDMFTTGVGTKSAQEGGDWRYSRNFGAKFSGYGMGLCRSSWYLRLMGGSGVSLVSLPSVGCVASAMFPKQGTVLDTTAISAAALRADAAIAAADSATRA